MTKPNFSKIITLWEWKKNGTAKARSVGLGNRLKKWLGDTFSPTSTLENLRLLLILESLKRKTNFALGAMWKRIKFDVKQAFLNANLDKPVYAYPPEGYYPKGSTTMWILRKALYGLCQSPRLWYLAFKEIMLRLGFSTVDNEPTLFIYVQGKSLLIALSINVDDSLSLGLHRRWIYSSKSSRKR